MTLSNFSAHFLTHNFQGLPQINTKTGLVSTKNSMLALKRIKGTLTEYIILTIKNCIIGICFLLQGNNTL